MNIYDVAEKAGVSIATVSRVINNKGYVSEKTRKKINAVLAEYDYQPNAIARGLATGTTKNIAIFAVDVRVPHYAATSYKMEQLLSDQGYMVLLCNTGEDIRQWRRYLQLIAERKVDGIILTGSIYNQLKNDDVFSCLENVPVVMANGKIENPNIKSVIVDEGHGIELATQHLYDRGHQHLAYIIDRDTESAQRKKEGFIRRMKLLGFPDGKSHVYTSSYGLESGAYIGQELYKKGYDGLVFGEDLTAVGALNALRRMGISIPGDVSITGCNNSEYSYICSPTLTSINNKAEILSELTVRTLVDMITKKNETADLVVLPELVVRESS